MVYWKYLVGGGSRDSRDGATPTIANTKTNQNRLYVPFYTQSQLEDSFMFLFLKLNLISFHTHIWLYIEYLLYRLAWLCIGPHSGQVLDLEIGRCSLTLHTTESPREVHFLYSTQSVYTSDYSDFNLNLEKQTLMCNRDYIYRSILRYHELLIRLYLRPPVVKVVRVKVPLTPSISDFSSWWLKCLTNKFNKTFALMQTEVSQKYAEFLIPPSDREWMKYRHHLQMVGDVSIWTVLYPDIKVWRGDDATVRRETSRRRDQVA
jgi:hypothetical protein